jgi:hypothetical protein
MIKAIKLIVLILSLANICLGDRIIPDPNFPVMIRYPRRTYDSTTTTGTANTVIEFRFRLPTRTKGAVSASGIGYSQFIAVRFEEMTGLGNLNVDCALSSATVEYTVSKVNSAVSDSSKAASDKTIYCQLKDKVNVKLNSSDTYTLTLTFGTMLSNALFQKIIIFTSSTNNEDAVIFDHATTFGTLMQYTNYENDDNNKIITISPNNPFTTITSPSDAKFTTLYPNFTFDLRLIFKVEDFWIVNPNDFLFYLKYETTNFSAPNTIDTESLPNASDSLNTRALTSGQLSFTAQTDGIIINGFKDGDLFPRKSFVLVLKGITTKDKNLGVTTTVRLEVYYKNTYSIVSYSKLNMNPVQIAQITATAHHPEYFYMYDGMGWPFQFNFTVNTKFENGGYVVVRHRNRDITNNAVNLVASTCDFSLTSFEQGFGKRLNCFPLRNDFNFSQVTANTTFLEGSGIFFKMASVAINTEYKFKVWGIIEKCVGTDKTKMYAATLTFTIRIYKSAKTNDTVMNESIFPLTPSTDNWIMAQNTSVSILDNCFGLQTRTNINAAGAIASITKIPFITDEFKPVGIEVNNFNVNKPPATLSTLNTFESADLWDDYQTATAGKLNTVWGSYYYLFGGTSSDLSGQNVFITAMIAAIETHGATNYNLADYIPSECTAVGTATPFVGNDPGNKTINDFRIQWLFSRDFLTEGTSISTGCQLNWLYQYNSNGGSDGIPTGVTFGRTLLINDQVTVADAGTYTDKLLTSISSFRYRKDLTTPTRVYIINPNMATTSDLSKIDSSSTASGVGATYKITSNRINFNTTGGDNRNLSMIGYNCNQTVDNTGVATTTGGQSTQFGLYSDCLKWKSNPSTVTSIYTYFEIQQILLYTSKYPSRIVRFIKLFPEVGVFHNTDVAEINTSNTNANYETGTASVSTEKWVTGHYETTTSTSAPFAVCLIEISAKIVNANKGTASNVLVIWLFGASLLDVDVTSETSEYPVAPLASATAYGLNAGQTMSYANRRIGDNTSGSVLLPAVDMSTVDETSFGEIELYFLKTVVLSKYKATSDARNNNYFQGYEARRTYYQFFLGSTVYINTTTFPSGSLTSYAENLYIPFLCPSAVGTTISNTAIASSTYPTNGVYWTAPIITAAWVTMDRYNSISKVDNYIRPNYFDNSYEVSTTDRDIITYGANATPAKRTPIQFPVYRSPSKTGEKLVETNPRQLSSTITARSHSIDTMKVQFKSYVLDTGDDPKTLVLTNIAATKYASAFSIFLNSNFDTITGNVTNGVSNQNDNNMRVKTMKTPIYVLGKPYNRFLAFSVTEDKGKMYGNYKTALTATATMNSAFPFTLNTAINIVNIPRLAISNFDSKGSINPLDFIAIFTNINVQIDDAGSLNKMLSNLKVTDNSGTITFQSFLLWHPEQNTSKTWSAELVVDITDKAIKEDRGGNIRISGTLPTEVPRGAEIKISFSNASVIQSATVTQCGLFINDNTEIVTDCTPASPFVTCKLNARTNKFKICCYNIYNDNTDMKVNYGQVLTNYDTTLLTSTLIAAGDSYNQIWYSYPADTTTGTLTNFNFSSRTIDDISDTNTSFFGKVTSIGYRLSSSENGFGLALIVVELPRNSARGMTVKITGDLARMKIPNLQTRITASLGNSGLYGAIPENGDLFLEYIYTNFDASGIVLKLKNMIYRCGLTLSGTINITMWPVSTSTFNAVNLTVSMTGPGGNALAASKAKDVTSTSVPEIKTTIPVSALSTDLCSISSISPRLVDEYATYNFTFNFSQFATTLEGTGPNEVIIILPYLYYEDYPDVTCISGTSALQCNYIEKSMLSVRFPNSINVSGDSTLVVSIIGLINPYLVSNNGVYFGCALTKADYLVGTRNYLVRGTTTLTEGIINATTNVTYGNIIFKNALCRHSFELITSKTNNSSQGQAVGGQEILNPREDPPLINTNYRSVHEFGFSLDIANNSLPNRTTTGFTLTNSPVLYITFPADYKFSLYSFTPIAEVHAYRTTEKDLEDPQIIPDFITVNTIEDNGNQLKITFTQTSFNFDKYFQHLLIRIYNLPPPVDNTDNTTTGRVTTESFRFTWVNSDNTMIFRTFRNLNNFSNVEIVGANANKLRVANKGFRYVFDQRKWVVDIQSADNSNAGINYLPIKAGIFNRASLKVRTNSKFLPPAKAGLVIDNNKIKISGNPYVVTAFNSDVLFLIGLPCDEPAGMYYVLPKFKLNDTEPGVIANPYLQFMPFAPLTVEISNQFKGLIMFPANQEIRINGSTFIDFSLTDPAFTDIILEFKPSADSLIEKTTILANKTEARTVMRITNANASAIQSYELGTPSNSCYEFQWPKISFVINSVAAIIPNDAIKESMFEYRNADTDNTITDFSTIRFNFVTEYTQIYVYAALACLNDNFPTDDQMKSQNVTSTPRLAFYSEILNIKGSAVIDFANLIRGNAYKLKVLIESTQGDKTLRTSSSMIKMNQTLTNGTIVSLRAGSQVNPLCASYRFKSRPGIQVTNPLLWYWQNRFSEGGYDKTGCIIAVDQYGTNIPGLPSVRNETSCGRQNCRFVDRVNYVVNQTQKDNSETYIICAYPYSTCTTNPSDYAEKFNTLLNELNTNITVNLAINAYVVPEFTLSTTSDAAISRTPTITGLKLAGGKATFSATSDSALSCYVKPVTGAQPAVTDFDTCTSGCTVINVSNVAGNYEVVVASAAGTYNLYAVCYNDMPCSGSRTSVVSWGSVTVSSGNNNNNGTNNNNTDNNGTASSSGYHYFTMTLLLLLALIMFE